MSKHRPVRIGVPDDDIQVPSRALDFDNLGETIDGRIHMPGPGVLGKLTSGEGPHTVIPFNDLPGGGGGSSYESKTYAEMQDLITADGLTPGGWYLITDASGTDLGFLTYAVNENTISAQGVGGYLNADFQGVGDYSGTPIAFNSAWNVWREDFEGSYVDGDVVVWNLLHWQVTDTGSVDGTDPETNTVAYTILPKSSPNVGYIEAWDSVLYDFDGNKIIFRTDIYGNVAYGQDGAGNLSWGRDNTRRNVLLGGQISNPNTWLAFSDNAMYANSIISDNAGNAGSASENIVQSAGAISENEINNGYVNANSVGSQGVIVLCVLQNGSTISNNSILPGCQVRGLALGVGVAFENNLIAHRNGISNKTFLDGVVFKNNTVRVEMSETETISEDHDGRTAQPGFSDFTASLDIAGQTTVDLTAAFAQYVGIFNLTSSNATETIDEILNAPSLFPFTLKPAPGLVLTIDSVPVSGISAGQIATKTAPDPVLDGDKGESITLQLHPDGYLYEVSRVEIF